MEFQPESDATKKKPGLNVAMVFNMMDSALETETGDDKLNCTKRNFLTLATFY